MLTAKNLKNAKAIPIRFYVAQAKPQKIWVGRLV